eukprot:gb/GEZN01000572.1/.p1 GENE.gb/GEZN01000572.1/~~gb/GEZN01000572.1/.p1  ORF type:complete len:1296 (+),score=258.54 gb/GEZN01000572.1/:67-3954(+)
MSKLLAYIDSYTRFGYYGRLENVCKGPLMNGNEAHAGFWAAYAQAMQGKYEEAMSGFSKFVETKDMGLAVASALINTAKMAGKDPGAAIKTKLATESKAADDASLLFAARYFWHSGKLTNASQCIQKVLSKDQTNVEALNLFGWVNLNSDEYHLQQAAPLFDSAIQLAAANGTTNIAAYLGRAAYYQQTGKWQTALQDLNTIITAMPDFIPAQEERARILMVVGEWADAIKACTAILAADPKSITAYRITLLSLLSQERNVTEAMTRLAALKQAMQGEEPLNAQLRLKVAQSLARLAGRDTGILKAASELLTAADKLQPNNQGILTEQANILCALGDYTGALASYAAASQGEASMQALYGKIFVKYKQAMAAGPAGRDAVQEAKQELDVLGVDSVEDPELLRLGAAMTGLTDYSAARVLLQKSVEEHVKRINAAEVGLDYISTFNPQFVLELGETIKDHIRSEPKHALDPPDTLLVQAIQLFEQLTVLAPGFGDGQTLIAQLYFSNAEFTNAARAIREALRTDAANVNALLTQAQIAVELKDMTQGSQSLEKARALSVAIRSLPVYSLLKASLFDASGQIENSVKQLKQALKLPISEVENPGTDVLSLYLSLAAAHMKMQEVAAAEALMQEAQQRFGKSLLAGRITLAEANLSISLENYDVAIAKLTSVDKKSPYYTRATLQLADLYRKQKGDKVAYTKVVRDLVGNEPSVHNYELLGRALLKIQLPDEAIKSYEEGLGKHPNNKTLLLAIGQAYTTTHQYAKAVEYYKKTSTSDVSKQFLLHELARLFLTISRTEEAVNLLNSLIPEEHAETKENASVDTASLQTVVAALQILERAYAAQGKKEEAKKALERALEKQGLLLRKLKEVAVPAARKVELELAAELNFQLAQYSSDPLSLYKQVVAFNTFHVLARLALAKIALDTDNLQDAQRHCQVILRTDANNEEAAVMMSEVMDRQGKNDFHFQRLLEKNPTDWDALRQLILVLRKSGRLEDAKPFLTKAEKAMGREAPSGFLFCSGMFERFAGSRIKAVELLGKARTDFKYAQEAVVAMIEIYQRTESDHKMQHEGKSKRTEVQKKGTQKLLEELVKLEGGTASRRTKVLECYEWIRSGDTNLLEQAHRELQSLVMEDPSYIPALVARVEAFQENNDQEKVRSELKLISNLSPRVGYNISAELETAYLKLARLYLLEQNVSGAKTEAKRVLAFNRSSATAWYILGQVQEKECQFVEASQSFQQAWNMSNGTDVDIGLSLADNYMKAKSYVQAVDVCHKVMKKEKADVVKLKQILQTARVSIRP